MKWVDLICVFILSFLMERTQSHSVVPQSHTQSIGYTNKTELQYSQPQHREYIVNVALFCDVDCGKFFNFDREKTTNYLAATILDANMYFLSLQKLSIMFAVGSLTQLNNTKDQPFIEAWKTSDPNNSLHNLIPAFSRWVFNETYKIPPFDYAILFTGIAGEGLAGVSNSNSLCHDKNERLQTFYGSAVIRIPYLVSSPCEAVVAKCFSFAFGHVGNVFDDKEHQPCVHQQYMFESQVHKCKNPRRFLMSPCSEDVIGKSLPFKHCLTSADLEIPSKYLLGINYDTTVTPTLKDQCEMATNLTDVFFKEEDENCLETSCYQGSIANMTFTKFIYPLANTPCGESKICFGGHCWSRGVRFRNLHWSTCIVSQNLNSYYNDAAILSYCSKLLTPLHKLILLDKGDSIYYLATPIINHDREVYKKCLTIDPTSNTLVFGRCAEYDANLEWSFIQTNAEDFIFLLFHRSSEKCVTFSQTSGVLENTKCELNDTSMMWEILERTSPTIYVMTTSLITPTLTEQCRIITNMTNAFSNKSEESCSQASCYAGSTGNETFLRHISPMINTICDDDNFCYRDQCLRKGYVVKNINVSKCIASSQQSKYDDIPVLSQCAKLPTPIDQLMLHETGRNKFHLSTPYIPRAGVDYIEKCLSLSLSGNNELTFDRCTINNYRLAWSFIKTDIIEQSFLLYHPLTKQCVNVDHPSGLLQPDECDFNQFSMKWEFFGDAPSDVFEINPVIITYFPTIKASTPPSNFSDIKVPHFSGPSKCVMLVFVVLLAFIMCCVGLFVIYYIFWLAHVRLSRHIYSVGSVSYNTANELLVAGNIDVE